MVNNNFNRMSYGSRNNIHNLQVPVNRNIAFIEIYVFTERGQFAIPGAVVMIYAKQENNYIPVYNTVSENYPIRVNLPVAHPLGTLIRGPEYYFTTYDITVEAANFAPFRINNVRLFEGITTRLDIDMFEIVEGQYPIPEKIINVPPHPRDEVNG